jgi:transcriptional regulator
MYVPRHFEETRVDVMHSLIREHPFALVVTLTSDGLNANHIPMLIDPEPAPFGTLRGHVARANRIWQDFSPEAGALAVFQGPQTYITPSWYPTKKELGMAVPTWNYAVVHAQGPLKVIEDRSWLRWHVERLTERFEEARPEPWHVTDAPADYIDKMLGAIVGLEISLTKLNGKWKVSQNRNTVDRFGVVEGLRAQGDAESLAMAEMVRERASRAT